MMNLTDLLVLRDMLSPLNPTPRMFLNAYLWNLVDDRPLEGGGALSARSNIYKRDPNDRVAFDRAPDYTTDPGAAIDLIELTRSGWRWSVRKDDRINYTATVVVLDDLDFPDSDAAYNLDSEAITFQATNPAWALCGALVNALVFELQKQEVKCP